MSYTLITPATTEPVTEAFFREHAALDNNLSSALLTMYLKSARLSAEHILGRALMTQTWEAAFDGFAATLELTMPPVESVVHVKYYDTAGVLQTIDPANYVLDAVTLPGYVAPAVDYDWPDTLERVNAVQVRFVCGVSDTNSISDEIKHWICMRAATAVQNREQLDTTPNFGGLMPVPFADRLLDRQRTDWGA